METLINRNVFSINNKSEGVLTIIVDPPHYVEGLLPNSSFFIEVIGKNNVNLERIFDVDYTQGEILIYLNYDVDKPKNYSIKISNNSLIVYEFDL